MLTHTLVVRMDRVGDVLLSGPLVRAVAAASDKVTYLASPAGAPAARLLPGVDRVLVDRAGWIEEPSPPVTRDGIDALVRRIARLGADTGIVLTSFHQSPLPMAMVLRMAGIPRIGAVSVDYPGSLLDVRHSVDENVHEVVRSLSLGEAMGYPLPAGDDGALTVVLDPRGTGAGGDGALTVVLDPPGTALDRPGTGAGAFDPAPEGNYIVVHPGASVSSRAWLPGRHRETVKLLTEHGWSVVVTGGPGERALTSLVAGDLGIDLGGKLSLPELARVIAGARAIVVGNTGPAHLAAAVGTPVVSLYAPTVPASRWRPWMVPHILLGDQAIACAGCRARVCPVAGHPCLAGIHPRAVVDAAERLVSRAHPRRPDGNLAGTGGSPAGGPL